MNNLTRMISMTVVWAAVTLIFTSATVAAHVSGFDLIMLTLIIGVAAVQASKYIWRGVEEPEHNGRERWQHMMQPPMEAKSKRSARNRLSRLVEMMDDDEAAEFLSDLKNKLAEPGSDGELSGLDALLAERDRKQR